MNRSLVTVVAAWFLLVVALLGSAHQATSAGEARRVFEGEGEVLGIDLERSVVTIRHREIPGLMSPMAMPFTAASREVLKGLTPGDQVRFKLEESGTTLTLTEIQRRGGRPR